MCDGPDGNWIETSIFTSLTIKLATLLRMLAVRAR